MKLHFAFIVRQVLAPCLRRGSIEKVDMVPLIASLTTPHNFPILVVMDAHRSSQTLLITYT